MKILQVSPFFAPKFGGPVTAISLLSKELVKRGHTVTIVTSDLDYDTKYSDDLAKSGVEVIAFHTVANFGLFIYTPSMKKWLKRNVSQYDIIHLHNFRGYQNSLTASYAKMFKIPYIEHAHGSILPFFEKQFLKRLYDQVWGLIILKNASKAIASCKSESAQYKIMGIDENKIEIIPNGVDLSQFLNLPVRGRFRSRYGIANNEKIILFLGRLHKIKGIDLLIDAYAELQKEQPNIRLFIVGPDDNFLSDLHDQISRLNFNNPPVFTGPLFNQEKLEAYIDSDIYVLPSRYETFPISVLEAWACGLPVIVTKGCLISDLVEQAGCVAKPDAGSIKNSLQTLLQDENFAKQLGERGQILVKNEFNNVIVTSKIESLYIRIVEGRV